MKEIGKRINSMVKEKNDGLIVQHMRVITLRERSKDRENLPGQIQAPIQEISMMQ